MAASFGLYFGNTNMCLAVTRDGSTQVVANDAGDRTTPAVISFLHGETTVGLTAKNRSIGNESISRVKRVFRILENETSGDENQTKHYPASIEALDRENVIRDATCPLNFEEETAFFTSSCGGEGPPKKVDLGEALGLLFGKMHQTAVSQTVGGDQTDSYPVVIAVPAYFTPDQRQTVIGSASDAGFHVMRVINEPVAAVLADHFGSRKQRKPHQSIFYVVYRVGGVSVDVSVVEILNGAYFIRSTVHKESLGGFLLTQLLADHCAMEYFRRTKLDVRESRKSRAKLNAAAEVCKHVLSTMDAATCFAESCYDGMDLSVNVSRARYESLLGSDLNERFKSAIREALSLADLSSDRVDKVILCGGSCRAPYMHKLVQSVFPEAELVGRNNADELIAYGAALEAGLLVQCSMGDNGGDVSCINGEHRVDDDDDRRVDTTAADFCVEISPSHYVTIFASGCPVPATWSRTVKLNAGQTSFRALFVERRKDGDAEPHNVAKLVMRDLPEGSTVDLTAQLNREGSIHVLGRCGEIVEEISISFKESF